MENLNLSTVYYTTSTVLEWQNVLLFPGVTDLIYHTWDFLNTHKRMMLYSYVIMPNHIHWLYKVLPPFTNDQIKHSFLSYTAKAIFELIHDQKDYFYVGKSNRKYQFWKSPSLSVPIFSEIFFYQKLNYIHANPQKAGLLDDL